MDLQNVKNITIPEGSVNNIHDQIGKLLWGRLAYDTTYAGDTFQQTYSGKNLITFGNFSYNSYGLLLTRNGNTLTAKGTLTLNTSERFFDTGNVELDIPIPAGTYTVSMNAPATKSLLLSLRRVESGSVVSSKSFRIPAGQSSVTMTTDFTATHYRSSIQDLVQNEYIDVTFENIQLEASSTPTSYEPYVGGVPAPNPDYPQDIDVVTGTQTVQITAGTESEDFTVDLGTIELGKIGSYQDYIYKSGDDWCVHKRVEKIVLNGSENWTISNSGTANFYYALSNLNLGLTQNTEDIVSNYETPGLISNSNTITGLMIVSAGGNQLRLRYGTEMALADWKTKLSTANMEVYYAVTTPTDTQITDNTLITQLNAIHKWLTRHGYLSNVTGNLPLLIKQTNL